MVLCTMQAQKNESTQFSKMSGTTIYQASDRANQVSVATPK